LSSDAGFDRANSASLVHMSLEHLGVGVAALITLWLMANGAFPEGHEVFLCLAAAMFNPRLSPFVIGLGAVLLLFVNQVLVHRPYLRGLSSFSSGLGWGLVAIPVTLGMVSLLSVAFLASLEVGWLV